MSEAAEDGFLEWAHEMSEAAKLSSRVRHIETLQAELADNRMTKANNYPTMAANLHAWIACLDGMTDEAYEADRKRWMANDIPTASRIERAGREHHPEDVASGAWGNAKAVRKAAAARNKSAPAA